MLRPTVFIGDAFIDYLEKKEQEFSSAVNYVERTENKKRLDTINRIVQFLLASNINTDLSENSIVKYYKKVSANKNYKSLKDHIYFNAVKNQRMKNQSGSFNTAFTNGNSSFEIFLSNVNDQTAVFFISSDSINSKEMEDKFGLVIIGTDFDFNYFYENLKIAGKMIPNAMDGIELCKHPCNSLIIVDPYFFSSKNNWRVEKAPNIIKTIKTFMSEKLNLKFHLLILTKTNNNDSDYQSKINLLLNELGGKEKVFIEVYTPKNIFSDDRLILTNYANINIGHPYDRDTYLNCNIFFSDTDEAAIRNNYSQQIKQYDLVKKEVQGTPEKIGLIKTIFTTDRSERNRLLFAK